MSTFDRLLRIGKLTWIAIWALVLLVRVSSDSPTTAADPSSYEAIASLQVLLCVLGFPLAPLTSYPTMALTDSFQASIAVAVIAVYVQWFHILPHLWRVFCKESELKP